MPQEMWNNYAQGSVIIPAEKRKHRNTHLCLHCWGVLAELQEVREILELQSYKCWDGRASVQPWSPTSLPHREMWKLVNSKLAYLSIYLARYAVSNFESWPISMTYSAVWLNRRQPGRASVGAWGRQHDIRSEITFRQRQKTSFLFWEAGIPRLNCRIFVMAVIVGWHMERGPYWCAYWVHAFREHLSKHTSRRVCCGPQWWTSWGGWCKRRPSAGLLAGGVDNDVLLWCTVTVTVAPHRFGFVFILLCLFRLRKPLY